MSYIAAIQTGLVCAIVLLATDLSQRVTTIGVGGGGSPRVRAEWVVDGANVVIEYGRPFLMGRREADMMPAGQPWRTGADAATILRTDKTLRFGEVTLAPGGYTIFTQPGESWQLILGRLERDGQWGRPYRSDLETASSAHDRRRGRGVG